MTEKPRIRVPAISQPVKAVEGEPRDGPWLVSWPNGVLPSSWGKNLNFWQMGRDPIDGQGGVAVVEACVNAYASTIAQCPGDVWRRTPDGGRERVANAASRVLRRPNDYQSRSDFIYGMVRDLMYAGNSFHLARRNMRHEVSELHPFDPRRSKAVVGAEESIWYELAGNDVLDGGYGSGFFSDYATARHRYLVPARDTLHLKLAVTNGEYLQGRAPHTHATDAIIAQRMIGMRLINMFATMGKPPGVIETELNLTKDQVAELRNRINEGWQGVDSVGGGPPILTNGLKFHGVSMTAKEAELAAASKLTQDQIFMVYGVPPAILGMSDKSAFASTESLIQFWLSGGLGFMINHIETGFDAFFDLAGYPDEYVELDTRALLRPQEKDRFEALARGVQGGILSPNEARAAEDLGNVPYGYEPRVQQQVVPLSAWEKTANQPAPSSPAAPPADEGKASFKPGIVARAMSEVRNNVQR
ncbi:phage portal protein [Sinorhizobium meliloti]|uniref:phage portal protein n=1 Tax=Rhizobium meliloti TaxID=382 RepID=UPI001F3C15A2|nr:phage portal protein [Sinorhizobium meliloti]